MRSSLAFHLRGEKGKQIFHVLLDLRLDRPKLVQPHLFWRGEEKTTTHTKDKSIPHAMSNDHVPDSHFLTSE